MTRIFQSILSLPFVVCAFLLLAGCGRTPGQFIVVQDQVPMAGCMVPSDLTAVYRPDGLLDISILNEQSTAGYLLFPLLENDLPGPSTGQLVDANRIALAGWWVHVDAPSAAVQNADATLIDYELPTSGSVGSGGGHTSSSVDVFRPGLAAVVQQNGVLQNGGMVSVEVTVHAIGNTVNGGIQSDDFLFPLTVCDGCLAAVQGTCPFQGTPMALGNPCNAAQDEVVDCCTIGGNLFCPPVVSQ